MWLEGGLGRRGPVWHGEGPTALDPPSPHLMPQAEPRAGPRVLVPDLVSLLLLSDSCLLGSPPESGLCREPPCSWVEEEGSGASLPSSWPADSVVRPSPGIVCKIRKRLPCP